MELKEKSNQTTVVLLVELKDVRVRVACVCLSVLWYLLYRVISGIKEELCYLYILMNGDWSLIPPH